MELRVVAVRLDGFGQVLWSRQFDPVRRPEDRLVQRAVVPLAVGGARAIVLEGLPGATSVADRAYWSDVRFE
ncbi:MAG: hypothetical protein AB1505_13795 [Candidatus Latescibacterota bacterium]